MADNGQYREDYAEPDGLDELADRHCRWATVEWAVALLASAVIGWIVAVAADRGHLF